MAAAGTATAVLAPRVSAAPVSPLTGMPLTVTPPPSSTLAELEARAMVLKPPVFLLETEVPKQFSTSHGSSMTIADDIYHTGNASLRWEYRSRAKLEVRAPVQYGPPTGGNGADIGADVDTLAFWIYQSEPSSGTLRIEAGRGSHTDVWCDMHLDFTGWRTAWIPFRDMNGRPKADMNSLRFVAPSRAGTLYLDYLIVNQPLRSNYPTRDRQVPFDNPGVATDSNEHWLDLLWFSQLDAQQLSMPTPTAAQLTDLATIESAYTASVGGSTKVTTASVAAIAAAVDALGVPAAGSSGGGGRPIFGYQNAIWPAAISDDLARLAPEAPLQTYTTEMQTIAVAYTSTTDATLQGQLADLYVRMLDHLWDQGWDDGSSQGTIHHLGYQARNLYSSVWLMRDLLKQRNLLVHSKAMLAWLVGMGRTRQNTQDVNRFYNGIMDIFNTTVMGMLGSALLADSDAEKVARVQLVRDWFNNGSKFSPGTEGGFKPDLATFHHMGHYPAYSRDGFNGGSPALLVLSGTSFAVSQETHQRWSDALLAMRFYANQSQWPLALSGRHPTGVDGLSYKAYETMTLAGSPDGTQELDPVMGAAFLRLFPAKPYSAELALAKKLKAAGVTAESSPTGCELMNHSALVSQRRDDWLVSVRGHNRYLWSTEIYFGSNDYGRYITYGHVQVMAGGDPVTNLDSGFVQPGWDWNRFPGTTTIHLPYNQLITNITPVGEEMLLTDQRLGGGGTIGGQNGAFLMSLHENAEYDGSFYARKSVFLFDNRVIALGEGIVNNDRSHHTETTLFQCYLADTSVPMVDSRNGSITTVPYNSAKKTKDAVWLIDPQQNGYYVPKGQELVVSRAVQTAPDQSNTTTASQPYATAVLDHGKRPHGGRYEYAMVVGATPEVMTSFAADMKDHKKAPYQVLRHDHVAHVVTDRATNITACAVFKPSRNLTKGLVRAVDTPSVVLVQPGPNSGTLAVSVTDPDLRLYDGPDTSAPTASPFGVPWKGSAGQGSWITVELKDRWTSHTNGLKAMASR
ncbi:MAG: chondroitinase family polysaccharide lyase [Nakamurella sp.]